jgi:transposase
VKRGRDWQERAHTILLKAQRLSASRIAQQQAIRVATVYERCTRWCQFGLKGLKKSAVGGAPRKLTDHQVSQVVQWASQEALTAPIGLTVHRSNTLVAALKRSRLVGKRTRHSLKKRDEARFQQAQVDIEAMLTAVGKREMELAYVDEVGFAQTQPNPECLDADRGSSCD